MYDTYEKSWQGRIKVNKIVKIAIIALPLNYDVYEDGFQTPQYLHLRSYITLQGLGALYYSRGNFLSDPPLDCLTRSYAGYIQ